MDNLITHYKLTIESTALKLDKAPASGAVFFVCGRSLIGASVTFKIRLSVVY